MPKERNNSAEIYNHLGIFISNLCVGHEGEMKLLMENLEN